MRLRELGRSARPWTWGAAVLTAFCAWIPLGPSLAPLLGLEGFRELADPRILRVLGRTGWMAGSAAAASLLLGLPLAVLAVRIRVPGARALGLLLPLPLLLPPLLVAAGWHGLTGMDGPWAAAFSLGTCYAPFPALLAARALARQAPAAHDAALLSGGPGMALRVMLAGAAPAALLGAVLAFLFAATDFAVPDYFGSVGEPFDVYANVIFNAWRDFTQTSPEAATFSSLRRGAAAAAPLLLLIGAALYAALLLRDRLAAAEEAGAHAPAPLEPGRWRWPLAGLLAAGACVVLLLPLGRIVYETGRAGPLAAGGWGARSAAAFTQALERGRADLGRSVLTGAIAAALAAVLAPIWAHALLRWSGRRARLAALALAMPLLTPAVALGVGAILAFNRDILGGFYASRFLPAVVMAGRFLPVAVFLLAERLQRVPPAQEEAAALAGASYRLRLFRYRLGPQRGAWLLAAGLVAVFSVRELDLAILLPAANASAAVRYYNALHFARDNFVAAFGLLIAAVLFLPVTLQAAWSGLRRRELA